MYRLYYHIRQIVTCTSNDLGIINSNEIDGLAIAVNINGKIAAIGTSRELWRRYEYQKYYDCKNGAIIPGFVDAHTHPVWAGSRIDEFEMKLAGKTYMEILKMGGGILSTVEATTDADENKLYSLLKKRLLIMMKHGTTTVECKTGYGLLWETELKMLKVLKKAKRELPIGISITYLAAHAIPKGWTADQMTRDIVDNQLPTLKQLLQTGEIKCDNIDVFCEKDIYELEHSKTILETGKSCGLNINAHCEELHNIKGTQMVSALGAAAISHLEKVDDEGIAAMARHDVTAVLLPSTAYLLRLAPPPVRKMINGKVRCALGSDFNPNAYCLSMGTIMNLACINYGMTVQEALLGATIYAAHSLGLQNKIGSLEVDKQADFLVLSQSRWDHMIYQLGEDLNLIQMVVKNGSPLDINNIN